MFGECLVSGVLDIVLELKEVGSGAVWIGLGHGLEFERAVCRLLFVRGTSISFQGGRYCRKRRIDNLEIESRDTLLGEMPQRKERRELTYGYL